MTYFTPYAKGTWIEDIAPALDRPFGREGKAIHKLSGKMVKVKVGLPDFSRCCVNGTPAMAKVGFFRWEHGMLALGPEREILFVPDT